MSRTLTALTVTPAETYATRDGTLYRADWSGIVHVEARHVAEMTSMAAPPGAAVPVVATIAQVAATHHKGAPLLLVVEG